MNPYKESLTTVPRGQPKPGIRSRRSDRTINVAFAIGSSSGGTAGNYVRDTVFLASVLFLVGISAHLQLRAARFGLVGVGVVLLVFSVIQLLGLPAPP